MFKEDRGWASQHAIDNGLASLVMDGPATGEESISMGARVSISLDGSYRLPCR